jgi:hypothetical protein
LCFHAFSCCIEALTRILELTSYCRYLTRHHDAPIKQLLVMLKLPIVEAKIVVADKSTNILDVVDMRPSFRPCSTQDLDRVQSGPPGARTSCRACRLDLA